MSLAPLDLVSAHPWRRVAFTTYALSLSFFEAVILDAMVRGGGREALILADVQGQQTRFFCFVDTVSARNFAGTNDAHGWIGLRFQLLAGGPPNDVLLRVNMRDASNVLQQQAIGILGVNLIYAAFYEVQTQESFLEGLAQDVVAERIEIDYVDLRGPAFESWDRVLF